MSDWFRSPTPLIIAHRGASVDAPENTLAAFTLALEEGAHGIELDVRISADGQPVVIHDATFDRTSSGRGRVSELNLNQISELLIEDRYNIPTLNQALDTLGTKPLYNIELKSSLLPEPDLAAAVSSLIMDYNLQDKVLISSFSYFALRQTRNYLNSDVPIGLLRSTKLSRLLHMGLAAKADHPHRSLISETYMAWAEGSGYRVNVWTVDDPREAMRFKQLGVNALITNQPAQIAKQLECQGG